MLSKVSAFHPGYRGQRYPVAHIPNGPNAGYIALTKVIDLDTALLIKLDSYLRRAIHTACPRPISCTSAGEDADCPVAT